MGTPQSGNFQNSMQISHVMDQIVRLCAPKKIYLYNQRMGSDGETTSFKLCVIVAGADPAAMERTIYVQTDSEVPFDVLLYSAEEWERLARRNDTFASKIARTGLVLYG